jgi:hypothetical protein
VFPLYATRRSQKFEEKTWSKEPAPDWQETVDAWPWTSVGAGGWEKSGPCPRCTHEMKVAESGAWSFAVEAPPAETTTLPLLPPTFYARCDCGEEHSGRPPDIHRGCGQWALIYDPPNE